MKYDIQKSANAALSEVISRLQQGLL